MNNNRPTLGLLSTCMLALLASQPSAAVVPGLECSPDACVLSLNDSLAFEVSADGVFEGLDHIQMTGDVTVHAADQQFDLLQAELRFTRNEDGAAVPFELVGTAMPDMAVLPIFEDASFQAAPLAIVGLAGRETLKGLLEQGDYELALAENPKDPEVDPDDLIEPLYLFFHFETGLSLDMPLGDWLGLEPKADGEDPFAFSVPGDKSVTLIVDPSEPYFFLSQDARAMLAEALGEAYDAASEDDDSDSDGRDPDPNSQDQDRERAESSDRDADAADELTDSLLPELGEIAFSWFGGIPFQPHSTWGLPDDLGHFKGHVYLDATVPLYKFIELTGRVVTHVSDQGFEQGGNGDVEVNFDLIPGLLSFSFPLGDASAGVRVTKDDVVSYFSGLSSPDYSFLPPVIPVVPSNSVRVAGYISSERPQDSRLLALGRFGYDMSGFRSLTGLDLNDLELYSASMEITAEGVRVRGRTGASLHPSIDLGGEARVEIFFSPRRPADSYLEIAGEMVIAGVGLRPVALSLDRSGLFVAGAFITPITEIALDGQITNRGPRLAGSASLDFSLGDLSAAIDKARDAVNKAQGEVRRLVGVVEYARAEVEAKRERHAAALATARDAVTTAQSRLNGLNSAISGHKRAISTYRGQISAKYRWYKRQHWTKKGWAWVKYKAYRAGKNAAIAWRYAQIGALNAAKVTAVASMELAKGALSLLEKATEVVPVDLDPRVAAPLAALHTATIALGAAELALPDLPDIKADISGQVQLQLGVSGLSGSLRVEANGLNLANGRVRLGQRPEACIDVGKLGSLCAAF